MVPLERGIWEDLFSAAIPNMLFAFFNAAVFASFSPMVSLFCNQVRDFVRCCEDGFVNE